VRETAQPIKSHPAVDEMVQRVDLLGGDDNIAAHRQHEHAGTEAQRFRMRGGT
jgi:hypothetical protein